MRTFFFAPESPRPVALVRMLVGLVFLVHFGIRWPYAVELYSTAGLPMPLHPGTALEAPAFSATWSALGEACRWLVGRVMEPPAFSAAGAVVAHSLLLFALVCVVCGWRTRTSLVAATVLACWLGLLDFTGTFKKYSVVGLHLMVLLAFTRCGEAWSLDRRLDPDRDRRVRLGPAWPRRLMQFMVCAMYLGAAVTKFRSGDYGTGDLLMFSLLDERWGGGWLGMWLSIHPRLLVLASLGTLVFETVFPFLVWAPAMRRPLVVAAVLFHAGMGAFLTLGIFTPVMLAALCAFLDERDLRLVTADGGRWTVGSPAGRPLLHSTTNVNRRRLVRQAVGFVSWGIVAGLVAWGGYAYQFSADWYGAFRGRAAEPLVVLDDDRIEEMFTHFPPNAAEHVYRVAIGTRVADYDAFGESRRFRPGERAWILVRLIRPHPAMTIEVQLVDPAGSTITPIVHRVGESFPFLAVWLQLTEEHLPGRYELIVLADGVEAARREFELVPAER